MRLQDLIDRRARAWEQYQEILARAEGSDDGLSDEDRQALDRAEADISQLSADIGRLERAEQLRSTFASDDVDRSGVPDADRTGDPENRGDGGDADERYTAAFSTFLRGGIDAVEPEQRQLLRDNFRAQGTTPDSAGGYLVPEQFRRRLVETMLAFGGLLAVANRFTTSTGAKIPWPTVDDTGNKGARLGENTQVTEQDFTFGTAQIDAYTYTSKMVRVPLQLLQDSEFDLDEWLPRKLGERIARIVNEELTTGTGTAQPHGVVTAAPTGKTGATGQTTSFIYDDLIDLEHSVDPAYRNERSRFMFHDLTLAAGRKIKDNDGRPIWQPSLQSGVASSLNGRPYTINNDMPQMGAGNKSILYGDFNAYIARTVTGGRVLRLTERYADYLQVGFLAFERWDGELEDTNAIKAYANAAS